jgi:tight adherence protein B
MLSLIMPLAIIGVVLSLIIILATLLLPTRDSQRKRELTEMVTTYARNNTTSADPQSVMTSLRTQSSARTAEVLKKRGVYDRFAVALAGAGIHMKPEEYALVMLAAGVGGGIGLFLLTFSIVAWALGMVIGLAIPMLIIRFKTARRQKKFVSELPDMLTALASGLSAGASLSQAFETVAKEAEGPMRDELTRAIMNSRLGTPIPDSLDESAVRMSCPELELVVMAIRLQSRHGGNLSELLNTVSATLRERVQMKRHVQALSAEGRLSVYVLMCLPLGMLFLMAFTRRDYFQFFIGTLPGAMMLGVGAIMLTLGYLWARSIVKVEV